LTLCVHYKLICLCLPNRPATPFFGRAANDRKNLQPKYYQSQIFGDNGQQQESLKVTAAEFLCALKMQLAGSTNLAHSTHHQALTLENKIASCTSKNFVGDYSLMAT